MNTPTSLLSVAFSQAASRGQCAFMPFITAGYPNSATFINIITALNKAGADIIEIGLPFSDPQADGPIIQAANTKVLASGQSLAQALDLIARATARISCPVVLMTYYNPVFKTGLDRFAELAAQAGAAGVIIPDLPPEEAAPWQAAAGKAGLETIFMVAPTTTGQRLEMILNQAQGFIYLVSSLGVTGGSGPLNPELAKLVERVKAAAELPVAVGFGISSPEQAAGLAGVADGVIVGSAFIKAAARAQSPTEALTAVTNLARGLKAALARLDSTTNSPPQKAAAGGGS